jgi:hypothetical protein
MGERVPDAFDAFAEGVKGLQAQRAFDFEFTLPEHGPEAAQD